MTESCPLVSVVTVNFNGEAYLDGLLRSLQRQSYRNTEILVVDNGSTDGSVSLVRRSFPGVRVIESDRNLGFTGGNNLGIRQARGSYVALINNDAVAEPGWLDHLVEEARSDPAIGGVGSKILFARPFVPVTVEVATFRPPANGSAADPRDLGVYLSGRSGFESCSYRKPIFKSGFYGAEVIGGELGRWTCETATALLPVESLATPGSFLLRVKGGAGSGIRRVRVRVGDIRVAEIDVGPGWCEHRFTVPAEIARSAGFDVINNAASFLRQNGEAGDRGIYEPDLGQYDTAEDVTSLCGCSMLLSRTVLKEVGAFDETLFMYFEDTELCWRIRKAGYRLRYQPKSVVRHFHAATSVEWSPLFHFLVSRNRILMLVRHASFRYVARAYLDEVFRMGKALFRRGLLSDSELRTRLRVQLSLIRLVPRTLLKRLRGVPGSPIEQVF